MAWLHPLGISNSPGSNAAVFFGQIQAATLSNAHKSSEHPSVVPHIWACILSSSTNQYYGSPKAQPTPCFTYGVLRDCDRTAGRSFAGDRCASETRFEH